MSETSLPPPHKNSNGLLIAGSLIVLLVLGGLFAWRATVSSDSAEPSDGMPAVSTVSSAVALPAPPPPPPETEAVPSAQPEATSTSKVTSVAPGRGDSGCSGACAGSADPALRATLRQRGGAAKGCYDKALRSKPTLEGKLMVAVRISPLGTVCSASVVSDSLGDHGVSNCILQNFRSASYPKPTGGCVDVQVPLNLIPSTK